jgi:hypothetical protein
VPKPRYLSPDCIYQLPKHKYLSPAVKHELHESWYIRKCQKESNQVIFRFRSPNLKMTWWENSDPLWTHSNSDYFKTPQHVKHLPTSPPANQREFWLGNQILGAVCRISNLGSGVYGWAQIAYIKYPSPITEIQVPKPKCLNSDCRYKVPKPKYLSPGTLAQIAYIKYPKPKYLNLGTLAQIVISGTQAHVTKPKCPSPGT